MIAKIILIFAVFLSSVVGWAQTSVYSAKAYDQETNDLVYTESHTVKYENNRVKMSLTNYYDDRGILIATMNSDYSKSLMMPTYDFINKAQKFTEGLRWQNGKYWIYRGNSDGKEEASELDKHVGVFSCQGWHYYLLENLESIRKKPLKLSLIFPGKLDYYDFEIHMVKQEGDLVFLKLEFDNFIIRMFAPSLELVYSLSENKLISYVGPSNIIEKDGEPMTVKIIYD